MAGSNLHLQTAGASGECDYRQGPSHVQNVFVSEYAIGVATGAYVLQEDPPSCKPISELGFDPILGMPTLADFTEMLNKERRGLKALLLDQVYADLQRCAPVIHMTGAQMQTWHYW